MKADNFQRGYSEKDILSNLNDAILSFAQYQDELSNNLEKFPMKVMKELSKWNNRHQKEVAVVSFWVEAFLTALRNGLFSKRQGEETAYRIKTLQEREDKLYDKINLIKEELQRKRHKIKDKMGILTKYSFSMSRGYNNYGSNYINANA